MGLIAERATVFTGAGLDLCRATPSAKGIFSLLAPKCGRLSCSFMPEPISDQRLLQGHIVAGAGYTPATSCYAYTRQTAQMSSFFLATPESLQGLHERLFCPSADVFFAETAAFRATIPDAQARYLNSGFRAERSAWQTRLRSFGGFYWGGGWFSKYSDLCFRP